MDWVYDKLNQNPETDMTAEQKVLLKAARGQKTEGTKEEAKLVGNEVEALYTNGPSGGGGAVKTIKDIVSITSILIPNDHFHITVGYMEV